MQILAAFLVVLSTTQIGNLLAKRLRARREQLDAWINVMAQLATHIDYGVTPLAEALESIGRGVGKPLYAHLQTLAGKFRSGSAQSVAIAWEEMVFGLEDAALQLKDRELLLPVGSILGQTDRQNQLQHLHLLQNRLQMERDAAWHKEESGVKMWRSLGVISGLFLILIVW